MRHTSSHIVSLALTALNRATLALPGGESAAHLKKRKKRKGFDLTTEINNLWGISADKLCNDLCASQATSD